jgi:hypothetical protein
MSLANILFIIVMLHLAAGFGWVIYKLEFEKDDKKKDDIIEQEKDEEEMN